jgi:hypothetical protein
MGRLKAPRVKHIHRYHRGKLGKKYHIYRCILPGCTHFISINFAVGRLSLCNQCDDSLILTDEMVFINRLAEPLCEECREKRRKQREALKAIPIQTKEENT